MSEPAIIADKETLMFIQRFDDRDILLVYPSMQWATSALRDVTDALKSDVLDVVSSRGTVTLKVGEDRDRAIRIRFLTIDSFFRYRGKHGHVAFVVSPDFALAWQEAWPIAQGASSNGGL